MNYFYLDAGASNGDSVRRFLLGELLTEPKPRLFQIVAFEPMPQDGWKELRNEFPHTPISLIEAAVWDREETRALACVAENYESNTVMPECANFGKGAVRWVRCLRLAEWIATRTTDEDYVTLKLDVEGAEYAVLEDLLATGYAKRLRRVWVEFHDWLMPAEFAARHASIMERFPIAVDGWA